MIGYIDKELMISLNNYTRDKYIENFPFSNMRDNQYNILNEICKAFNSGYRYILLEAPTGFGKSPVAMAVAMTLGSSYICTSTKDLQTQYARDFPFVRIAKGMNNFPCLIKEDLIKNNIYECSACSSSKRSRINPYCSHTTVDYGPCLIRNNEINKNGCIYKAAVSAYEVSNRGTKNEQVFISSESRQIRQQEYYKWLQDIKNLKESRKEWAPCGYYDQLNLARNASHSIFNYAMFLTLLPSEKIIAPRQLLVLDEGHLLEAEIVNLTSFVLSKSKWRKYIAGFSIIDYGYQYGIEAWVDFLVQLEAKMLALLGDPLKIKELVLLRKQKYNYKSTSIIKRITNTKITHFIGGGGEEEEQKLKDDDAANNDNEIELHDSIAEFSSKKIDKDLEAQAILDIGTLTAKIDAMLSNPKNWVLYNIKKDDNFDDISSVEFKMLDVSEYCKSVFDRCYKTLIMSATILNPTAYCRTVGLNYEDVKVIQVPSSFPVENRPIHSLNIAYLNLNNLQLPEIKSRITKTIDDIMTIHRNHKGIIHTTSYEQLNFIKENISENNAKRLVETNPNIERDEVIAHHVISNSYNNNNNNSPTVLISPSLYTGIDLKDDLSRFQIIVKVPYPNLNDKWIAAKMQKDKEWYYWQTALRLVQAYGRSVRSKEDWAKTYILDSAFTYFVKRNGNILPDWFKQAVKLS